MIMNQGLLSISSPTSWPENDFYFRSGVSSFYARLKPRKETRKYYFLNLNGSHLRKFLQDFPEINSDSIVIISTPRLMPLANFWLMESSRVCAVFESYVSIDTIVSVLNGVGYSGKFTRIIPWMRCNLSAGDVLLLKHYLESGNMSYMHSQHNRAYSTIQSWKTKLAKKFNVRKLEYLLLN